MCDMGGAGVPENVAKTDSLGEISEDTIKWIEKIVSRLLNCDARVTMPKLGEYPQKNTSYKDLFIMEDYSSPTEKIGNIQFHKHICRFYLSQLSGCCGVLVSHHMEISRSYQGRKLGTLLQLVKERIAKEAGYTVLLATVRKDNPAENHILEKTGWNKILTFTNKRTSNEIFMWSKTL